MGMENLLQKDTAMKLSLPFQRYCQLKKQNTKLAVQNIILTADIETIAEDPGSDKSKEIIARYRGRIQRRNEREQATQN